MNRISKRMSRAVFAAGVLLLLASQAALGADGIWSVTAFSDQWSEPGNWVGGIVPLSSTDNATIPGGASNYPVIQNESVFLNNLTIANGGDVAVGDLASMELFGLLTVGTGGKMTVSGNPASVNINTADISGLFVVTPVLPAPEAVVTLASTFSINSGGTFQLDLGGRVAIPPGSASLFINGGGIFQMNGGIVNVENNTGGLEIAPTGVFQMDGGTIDVGAIGLSGGRFAWNGDFQMNGGFVNVTPDSTIVSDGTLAWTGGEIRCADSANSFPWTNMGTIEISPGGSPSLWNCEFTNDGTFTLLSAASLVLQDASTTGTTRFVNDVNGTINGSGTIEFSPSTPWTDNIRLVNNGTLAPGGTGTIGAISILGDFENNGILEADISTTGNDELTVDAGSGSFGSVTLNGEFIVDHITGTYSDGQQFPIIDYQLQSGTFTTFTPTPPPGFTFDPIDYGPGSSPGNVTLALRATGPTTPEWDGSEDSDWFNPLNWVGDAPPTAGNDIRIPVVTSPAVYPVYPFTAAPESYGIVTLEGELTIDTGAGFSASFAIADGAKLTNQGSIAVILDSTNSGLISWTAGSITLGEGTYFTNAATGRIECDNQTAGTDLVFNGGPASRFINQGAFVKTGPGGAVLSFPELFQDGVMEASGGTLALGPGLPFPTSGRYAGEFRLANDADLILGRGSHLFAKSDVPPIGDRHVTGQGRLLIGDPNVTDPVDFPNLDIYNNLVLDPGVSLALFSGTTVIGEPPGNTPHTISGGGQVVVDDATSGATPPTMYLNSDLTIDGPLRVLGGGIDGPGDLNVNGPFEWTGGLLAGTSQNGAPRVVLESGATTGNSAIGGTGTTLKLSGRDLIILGGATVYDGRLEFGQSAKVEIGDSNATGSPAVLNVQNNPVPGMTFAPEDEDPGEGYGVFNYGTITGSGRLAFAASTLGSYPPPDFGNFSAIAPGNGTPGTLVFDVENYNHLDGELQVNLLDATLSQWDRMDVSGLVDLGGALAVDLDFSPQNNDEFVIMTHGGINETGAFGSTFLKIGGVDQPFAEYFDIIYEPTQVKLRYIGEATALANLSVSVSPSTDAGSVDGAVTDGEGIITTFTCPDACSGTYPAGTLVSLTAIPNSNHAFVGWEYSATAASFVSESGNTALVTLGIDIAIAAVFAPAANMATLSIVVSPPGSGTVSGQAMSMIIDPETGQPVPGEGFTFTCPEQCSVVVPTGSSVSLSAAPAAGFSFSGWQGADSVTGTSAYVEMTADRQVTASFFQPSPQPPPVDDNCPDDPLKTEPGVCGCGVPDIDTDGDETLDCNDGCPEDPDKTEPGVCGCGTPDTDSDDDGTPDCNDRCPADPGKTEPGACGCGNPETDTDQDGAPDCVDACPADPGKTAPGVCGCGTPDTDSDDDGTPDCADECPQDALKTAPGVCGCGIPDLDSDGDGAMDCIDLCPGDPDKTEPGACGCGISDADDQDDDGTPDCTDRCPCDPSKTGPGVCGCGIPDIDADGNGTPDCLDEDSPFVLGQPAPVFPEDDAFLEFEDVVLEGLIFFSGQFEGGLETHWWIRPADKRIAFRNIRQTTYGGYCRYQPKDIVPGVRYIWRFGYRSPFDGRMVWSETRTFTVGLPVEQTGLEIPPGTILREYRMRTFPAWTVAPDLRALLLDAVGRYDPRFFRIGGWDPENSRYVEFSSLLDVTPGRAFWFLAREGFAPVFPAAPVTVAVDMCVELGFDEASGRGWNQIAAPNHADYYWGDVLLVAFAPTDDPEEYVATFGPTPLSELDSENPYIHLTLWRFNEQGGYDGFLPGADGSVLLREEGYWVEARRGNIGLIFPASAQQDFTSEETLVFRALREARRLARTHLTPADAVARSGESPPMPMGELNAYSGSDPSSRVDGGGGGCFIEAISSR